MDDPGSAPADYHDRMTVAKSFALAIGAAAERHPAAEPLLVAAALLPPEPIPLFLFDEGREKLAEGLGTLLEGRGRAVAELRRFGLVDLEEIGDERDLESKTEALGLIRLAAEWRRDRAAADSIRGGLIEALTSVYPDGVYNAPAWWPRARRLDAVALGLLGGGSKDLEVEAESRASLLQCLGTYRYATGAYSAARPLFERALAIRERVLSAEHPRTATSLNDLAVLLQDQGDLSAARRLFERTLAITRRHRRARALFRPIGSTNGPVVPPDGALAFCQPTRDLKIGRQHPTVVLCDPRSFPVTPPSWAARPSSTAHAFPCRPCSTTWRRETRLTNSWTDFRR
jgi:tetratricopeptide (TPR) repeat protein